MLILSFSFYKGNSIAHVYIIYIVKNGEGEGEVGMEGRRERDREREGERGRERFDHITHTPGTGQYNHALAPNRGPWGSESVKFAPWPP